MKVIRPICCGMGVHKDLVVATIATSDNSGVTQYNQSSFSTQNYDLLKLKSRLKQHNCIDACMESTGKYWIPIFNIPEDEINVYLTHPKYVKAIKGKKTDKKDSKWITDLFKFDLLKFSLLTPKEIRELRELSRYRIKLVGMRSSERNRYQNSMTVSNIGHVSILSDPFGKTATAIMQEVLSSNTINESSIKKLIHGTCAEKTEAILASLQGSHIETDQKLKMNTAFNHIQELDNPIETLEIEMMKRCVVLHSLILFVTLQGYLVFL